MSRASFSFSSTIWSLDSKMSMASRVNGSLPYPGRKSRTWHIVSRSTITSMGRPDGATKYICRSPLRLLNRRSGSQPLSSRNDAVALRPFDKQAKSMSWPGTQARRQIRSQDPDGKPAEELQADAGLLGRLGQREGFGQRIVGDGVRRLARLCHGCSRCVLRR